MKENDAKYNKRAKWVLQVVFFNRYLRNIIKKRTYFKMRI